MLVPDRATGRSGVPGEPRADVHPIAGPEIVPGEPILADDEELLVTLPGIGAVLYLTTERLIIVRDGSERRPRNGIQSFGIDAISHVRIEPGTGSSGRIAISTNGHEAVSMFFDARAADRAREAIDRFRPLLARRRRESGRAGRPPGA